VCGRAPPAAPLRESRRYNGGADMNGVNVRRVWDAACSVGRVCQPRNRPPSADTANATVLKLVQFGSVLASHQFLLGSPGQVPHQTVPHIVPDGVGPLKPSHARHQVGNGRLKQQMVVVASTHKRGRASQFARRPARESPETARNRHRPGKPLPGGHPGT